jgi:riboflavin kinase/FMN adenylyltransferase
MQVYRNLAILPLFNRAVVTIGTFDGVHSGHQEIIRQLKQEAERIGGETVIITFDPHPRKVVGVTQREIKLINTLEEKIELLAMNGIDHLVVIPFTVAFSQMTAEEYIRDFLISQFHPHTIIIGYDHRFGQGRIGNYELMEVMKPVYGYELCEIPVQVLNQISVSSTRIREAVAHGDILTANELLRYHFFFEGVVVEGNKLGRTIGFPTANLQMLNPDKLIPGNGVYAVSVDIRSNEQAPRSNHSLKGMMNIGFRPTVEGTMKVIEVNLFDFNQNIYGECLRIHVRHFLRPEQKFEGLEALKSQLKKDQTFAIALLKQ